MTTQEITLDQNSDDGLYTQLLRDRYVTSMKAASSPSTTGQNSTSTATMGVAAVKAAGTGLNRSTSREAGVPAS